MRKFRVLSILSLLVCMLQGCQSHDSLIEDIGGGGESYTGELTLQERISLLDDYEISESTVLNILEGFDEHLYTTTKGGGQPSELKVLGKETYTTDTRAVGSGLPAVSSSIYKIEMTNGERRGYALVSADMRSPSVIYYMPDTARLGDDAESRFAKSMRDLSVASHLYKVAKFEAKKDSLRHSAMMKLEHLDGTRSSKEEYIESMIVIAKYVEDSRDYMPLTATNWEQGYPYNSKLGRDCPDNSDGRYNAGCGVVAIAQALAHYEPSLTISGNKVDWKALKKQARITAYDDKTLISQIGSLMKWVGEQAGAVYGCDGTMTAENAICNVLSVAKMQCDRAMGWNWDAIYNSLKQGSLVHVSATEEYGKRHAWLIDGFIVMRIVDEETLQYLRHNFGWSGYYNGYFEVEPDLMVNTLFNFIRDWRINPNIKKQ